jgi:MOSC domain-containing protein YiiM
MGKEVSRSMRKLISLNISYPKTVTASGMTFFSGYKKQPQQEPVFLHSTHFTGDGVGDTEHHGGPDKAVCLYPHEHYEKWNTELELDIPLSIPSFGENLTTFGLLEDEVCIGDVYKIGEAVLQAAQPRVPCNKLASVLNRPDMIATVSGTGRTGFYFRVLNEGMVKQGEEIQLLKKHEKGITISDVNEILYGKEKNKEKIAFVMEIEELAESLRKSLSKRL